MVLALTSKFAEVKFAIHNSSLHALIPMYASGLRSATIDAHVWTTIGEIQKQEHAVSCTLIDECAAGTHDCDRNARCIDTDESFICTCHEGFNDESPDPSEKPGRVCTQREFGRNFFHRP
uniref:EGF-like domain-containing protein n=1 Tax=Parascaris equorum TaxID=6256 RepID=A0A914R295_PAREQ